MRIKYKSCFINGEDKTDKIEDVTDLQGNMLITLGYAEMVQKNVQETVCESDTTDDMHKPIWPQETRRLRGKKHVPKD